MHFIHSGLLDTDAKPIASTVFTQLGRPNLSPSNSVQYSWHRSQFYFECYRGCYSSKYSIKA
jgi:hypothetical protein